MQMSGSKIEEGINWRITERSSTVNRSGGALVVIRGKGSGAVADEATSSFGAKELWVKLELFTFLWVG